MRVVKALACALAMALLAGCQSAQLPVIVPVPSPTAYSEAERAGMLEAIARYRTWYDGTMERLGQLPLIDAMNADAAVQEYRVLSSQASAGYAYYRFCVNADGEGRFVYMTLGPELDENRAQDKLQLLLDTELSIGETQALLDVMAKYDFFDIPPRHPDEADGDSPAIFLEGSDGDRIQFAKMFDAPASYPIAQIKIAMQEFAEAHMAMEGS